MLLGTSNFYISHNHMSLETYLDSSLNLFHHTWLCVGRCAGRSDRGSVRPIGTGVVTDLAGVTVM